MPRLQLKCYENHNLSFINSNID